MRVVHIQNDMMSAGRAALRLHNVFIEAGIESSILTLFPDVNDTDLVNNPGMLPRFFALIDRQIQAFLLKSSNKKYGSYSYPFLGTNISKLPQLREADIIYIHWVQAGFLNLSNFRQLALLGKPVIIFMHDMWAITGGCHHSFSCEKYKIICRKCQIFSRKNLIDWPKREFIKKRKLYNNYSNLFFVSPSKWLFECAKASGLTNSKSVFHIPNILNTSIFKPLNKSVARQALNVAEDETIIAFGAFSVNSPYKGWSELQKALDLLKDYGLKRNISVLIIGSVKNDLFTTSIPFKSKFLGFLKDEYSMSLIYNSADIFVAPSLAETFGYVIMEALSCGTPVVAFDVGGITDQIRHRYNGYLARYRDSKDLADGIKFCLENNLKGSLLPEFESNKILRKHIGLMDHIQELNR